MKLPVIKSICTATALLASQANAISNWEIVYQRLETDFQYNVTDEITMEYIIGSGVEWKFTLSDVDDGGSCADTSPNVTIHVTNATSNINNDQDQLKIMLDLNKTEVTSSNIWNNPNIQFCALLELLSGQEVMKEDEQKVTITFEYLHDINITDVTMTSPNGSPGIAGGSAELADNFISVCKCDNFVDWNCNSSPLGPDDILHVCAKSKSTDVRIQFIKDLRLFQEDTNELLLILDGSSIQNDAISFENKVENGTLHGIGTAIPLRFFQTVNPTISVTGIVQTMFVGQFPTRRLAELDYAAASVSISTRAMRGEKTIARLRSFGVQDDTFQSTPSSLSNFLLHSDSSHDTFTMEAYEESYDPYLGIELSESMSMSMSMPDLATTLPSKESSSSPTKHPSATPMKQYTRGPTEQLSATPTVKPSESPTTKPSNGPSIYPSLPPSKQPTEAPSKQLSASPSKKQPVLARSNEFPVEQPAKAFAGPQPSRSASRFGFTVGLARRSSGMTAYKPIPVVKQHVVPVHSNGGIKGFGTTAFLGALVVAYGGLFW